MGLRILAGAVVIAACGRIGFESRGDAQIAGTCGDAVRDGDETGIDCGGSCLPCAGAPCSDATGCASGACVTSRCELASGPPFWLPGPDMVVAREQAGCATNGDGILIVGGLSGANAIATTELLAPFATSWVAGPSLPGPRVDQAVAATLDGTVYSACGYDATGTPLTELDGLTGTTWSTRTGTPTAHAYASGAGGDDGKLYVFDNNAMSIYTPATDSWVIMPPPTVQRDSAALTRGPDQLIYAVGGRTGTPVAAVDTWDTSVMAWSSRASLTTAREGAGAATAGDGRIYAIGGLLASGAPGVSVEAYALDHWTDVAALSLARAYPCAAVGADDRIYILGGGTSATTSSASVEVYGPVAALSPTSAAPGETVAVAGNNFAANAAVAVSFDGAPVAAGTTDGSGAVTLDFVVPAAGSGAHDVVAVDNKSQFPTRAQLQLP